MKVYNPNRKFDRKIYKRRVPLNRYILRWSPYWVLLRASLPLSRNWLGWTSRWAIYSIHSNREHEWLDRWKGTVQWMILHVVYTYRSNERTIFPRPRAGAKVRRDLSFRFDVHVYLLTFTDPILVKSICRKRHNKRGQ